MRFGICGDLEVAKRAIEAGYDYTEAGATRFALEDPFDPASYRAVRTETSNLFFPGSIKLIGPEATPFKDYASRAVQRASEIGIEIMVIGSGGSRRAPEGISNGDDQFVEIVAAVAEIARPYGIRIAPESLNRTETNVGNDLGRLSQSLRAKGAGYTADSYHILFEWNADGGAGTPSAEVWQEQLPFAPDHVHIADLPRHGVDAEDPHLVAFARRLQELGYDGRVSLEANLPNTEVPTLAAQLDQLRQLFYGAA